MGKNVPVADFAVWRYQIHIGGNSSAWSGLFQELITASPVLKVARRRGGGNGILSGWNRS